MTLKYDWAFAARGRLMGCSTHEDRASTQPRHCQLLVYRWISHSFEHSFASSKRIATHRQICFSTMCLIYTFATPTLLARDGPVPGLRLFTPAPGALDLLALPKICCARASFLRRWRSGSISVSYKFSLNRSAFVFLPALMIALKSAAAFAGAMVSCSVSQ